MGNNQQKESKEKSGALKPSLNDKAEAEVEIRNQGMLKQEYQHHRAATFGGSADQQPPSEVKKHLSEPIARLDNAIEEQGALEPNANADPQTEINKHGLHGLQPAVTYKSESVTERDNHSIVSDPEPGIVVECVHFDILVERGNSGLGFSIAGGRDSKPYMDYGEGIFISRVMDDGPAYTAGLKVGDKVLLVNGVNVEEVDHCNAVDIMKEAGATVELRVVREVTELETNKNPPPITGTSDHIVDIQLVSEVMEQWPEPITEQGTEIKELGLPKDTDTLIHEVGLLETNEKNEPDTKKEKTEFMKSSIKIEPEIEIKEQGLPIPKEISGTMNPLQNNIPELAVEIQNEGILKQEEKSETLKPLPKSIFELSTEFKKLKLQDENTHIDSPRKKLIEGILTSAKIRRSVSKSSILLVGSSGVGKSSTVNHLFNLTDENEIAKTSDRESETRVTSEYMMMTDYPKYEVKDLILSVVDSPGFNDTAGVEQDVKNFFSIKRFFKEHPDLMGYFPNLIFVMVQATDTRISGENSNLSKTLKCLRKLDLVDNHHPNVVGILTFGAAIRGDGAKWRNKIREKEQSLKEAIFKNLRISAPIIAIDNDISDLEKVDDYSRLPDETLQAKNLYDACKDLLEETGDMLGQIALNACFLKVKQPILGRSVKAEDACKIKFTHEEEQFYEDLLKLYQGGIKDEPNDGELNVTETEMHEVTTQEATEKGASHEVTTREATVKDPISRGQKALIWASGIATLPLTVVGYVAAVPITIIGAIFCGSYNALGKDPSNIIANSVSGMYTAFTAPYWMTKSAVEGTDVLEGLKDVYEEGKQQYLHG